MCVYVYDMQCNARNKVEFAGSVVRRVVVSVRALSPVTRMTVLSVLDGEEEGEEMGEEGEGKRSKQQKRGRNCKAKWARSLSRSTIR